MKRGPIVVLDAGAALGGAELSLLPVVGRLAQEHRVIALLPSPGPLASRLSDLGVELADGFMLTPGLAETSGSYGTGDLAWAGVLGARQQARLAMTLRSIRPTLVYCNGFRAQVAGTMPARAAGAGVVWHVRDFARPGWYGRLWSQLARATSGIIANSHATGEQPALARASGRVTVVHNGIPTDLFRRRPQQLPDSLVIGMASHLTPWKGHLRFVRLLSSLRAVHPTLTGRIAGDAIYDTSPHRTFAGDLASAIEAAGLASACRVEAVAPEGMPEWLSELTALVHCPDRPEPFGRVLAEALAVGVPVISSADGGAREVLGEAAVNVPSGSEQALRAAALQLLGDPVRQLELSDMGVQRAAAFDERRYTEAVVRILLRHL